MARAAQNPRPKHPAAAARAPRPEVVDLALELLAPLGRVRARAMFGGHGVYVDELFVALVAEGRLYLKTGGPDDEAAFAAAGGEPFVYDGKGRPMTLRYWTPPPEALESPALMAPWARRAVAAALSARSTPAARKTVPPAAGRQRPG